MPVGLYIRRSLPEPLHRLAMAASHSAATVYVSTAVLGVLAPIMINANLTLISESLPQEVRAAGFGLLYAVGTALFGGFSQFFIKALIDISGNPVAPAWYLTVALLTGGASVLALRQRK